MDEGRGGGMDGGGGLRGSVVIGLHFESTVIQSPSLPLSLSLSLSPSLLGTIKFRAIGYILGYILRDTIIRPS